MTQSLETYLDLPWQPVIDTVTEGDDVSVRLTVPGLRDFAVYGDSVSEVKGRWREALESHLEGYIKVGKVIPTPVQMGLSTEAATSTGSEGNGAVLPARELEAA